LVVAREDSFFAGEEVWPVRGRTATIAETTRARNSRVFIRSSLSAILPVRIEPLKLVCLNTAGILRPPRLSHKWLATPAAFSALLIAGVVVSSWMAMRAIQAEAEGVERKRRAIG
jgi:hypothetical protein